MFLCKKEFARLFFPQFLLAQSYTFKLGRTAHYQKNSVMDLREERARVGDTWTVFRSNRPEKGYFEYRRVEDNFRTWDEPDTCEAYAAQDRFDGLYRAPTFFQGVTEDYYKVVEDFPDAHNLRSKLRADVDDDNKLVAAHLLADSRIRMFQREVHDCRVPSEKVKLQAKVALWQHESSRALVAAQQRFVLREQRKAGPRWKVRYNMQSWNNNSVHKAIYRSVETNQDHHDPPSPTERYIEAVEDDQPSRERELELDEAREHVPIRTCIDVARTRRDDNPGWELELQLLYVKVVKTHGVELTPGGCELIFTARHVYGVEKALDVAWHRNNRFDPEWKVELYLGRLLKHKDVEHAEVAEARRHLPHHLAANLLEVDEHLGMVRALGSSDWFDELNRLQVFVDTYEEPDAPPDPVPEKSHEPRRAVRCGSGALPFVHGASSRVLSGQRTVQALHEQVPDGSGCVPFRTNSVVMTCIGKGECVLEAVRFATADRRLSRATFDLPKRGDINLKALVRGARLNRDFPFAFVKQTPTNWAGLPLLPWGIYLGRVVVGAYSHMIVYCSWRHLLFLGGDCGDPNAASRGWFLEEEEIKSPHTFQKFMVDLLGPQLQTRIDAIYRVDVHSKKLHDTAYC